ncbi:MAG: excalibur calcium-binding domain-containing protein [Hyphomonadaceae bacterium]|nr:excalibur calcium-binding domain-containing protein [Hyphomonadaceae bacterium]
MARLSRNRWRMNAWLRRVRSALWVVVLAGAGASLIWPYVRPRPALPADVYFRNCDEARSADAAPMLRGQPGYRSGLDRDGDGVACEPYYGRRR